MSESMNGHVQARRDWLRERAAQGDERAARGLDDGMIASIELLLAKWGRWAIRCEAGALGFASSCVLGGIGPGDSYDSALPHGVIDEDMEEVNGAIKRLPAVWREVVIQVYQHGQGKSKRENASALGVTKETLGKYLRNAYEQLALDISKRFSQNRPQSANGGSCP